MITVVEEDELALICHLQGKQKKNLRKGKTIGCYKTKYFLGK